MLRTMDDVSLEPPPYRLARGDAALLVSMPHVGTHVPSDLAAKMTPQALALADTDWHLVELYDFLGEMGATVLAATHSRLVVDINRPPDGASLYPGQDTTGLVPVDTFRKEPVYRDALPAEDEIAQRRERFWLPYHRALAEELARLRAAHPRVVLWDAHSIASRLSRFFEGRLPDLNFGTARGGACAPALIDAVLAPVRCQRDYTWVLDGRFTGGYITRRYGEPAKGVHAVQLEMSQVVYMDEAAPFAMRAELARKVRPLLRACLDAALDWARRGD